MKPHFNLVDEPWIPCLLPDHRAKEFGLREVLARAHEVREIFHPSPLVVIALHRLLLAILHRNFGPETLPDWQVLWGQGRWNEDTLEHYFSKWRDRFYLFHPERPFCQVPKMADAKEHPVQKLAEEAASLNNPTLFDHSFSERPQPFSPAQAARYVLACQSFALGGGVSRPFNFSHAPLVRGYTVLVLGDNLFETLTLNFHIYNSHQPIPWRQPDDPPAWERDTLPEPDKRGTLPQGYLDYLTFQSRRLHLVSEDGSLVGRCQILQNLKLPDNFDRDPFMCHLRDPERGVRPLRLDPDRAVWRDSHTLFDKAKELHRKSGKAPISTMRPEIFNWVARLRTILSSTKDFRFSIAGLVSDRAKVLLWRQERLPLPLAYLDDVDLLGRLKVALDLAERANQTLIWGLRWVASLILSPESGGQSRPPDRGEVDRLLEGWAPGRLYWSRLEAPFRQLLVELPDDHEEGGDGGLIYGSRKMPEWSRTVYQAATETFADVAAGLERSVRSLKAVARVEGPFRSRLHRELLKGGEL